MTVDKTAFFLYNEKSLLRGCVMKDIFKNAEWITASSASAADEHRCYNYFEEFSLDEPVATLYISAFSQYAVWVNGEFCDTDVFEDYDFHPNFDTLDISRFCKRGRNTLVVGQYVCGADFSTCSKGIAGVIFAVYGSEKCVCASSTETLSARDTRFLDAHEPLSPQLGFNSEFDARALLPEPKKSIPVNKTHEIVPRPIEKCVIGSLKNSVPVSAGVFREKGEAPTKAARMANADIDFRPLGFVKNENGRYNATVDTENCDGLYFLFDLGGETTGYLSFSASVPSGTEILVGFGEHAENGRVPCSLALLNCCFRFIAKEDKNDFFLPYRRLGLRFLQVHIFSKTATLENVGIAPSEYPLSVYPCPVSDELLKKIYEVGIKTLRNCMHTHYEDCPWREQSLYCLDSRIQILCGYYAFREYRFPRASIALSARSLRERDSLLEICSPGRVVITIPSFTAVFLREVYEYTEYSGDETLFEELFPTLEKIADGFVARVDETGLIPLYTEPEYWNFYEWRDGLDGSRAEKSEAPCYESPLCFFVADALLCLAKLCENKFSTYAKKYSAVAEKMKKATHAAFFDKERGAYRTRMTDEKPLHALPQALALYADAVPEEFVSSVENALLSEDVEPVSLSMTVYAYEAFLKRGKRRNEILSEIRQRWGRMTDLGVDTFWVTDHGASAFGGIGSLCHGWSAVPVYILSKYFSQNGCS